MNPDRNRPTIAEALRAATARLEGDGIETARLDAEVLLRHALGVDRTRLFLRLREPLPVEAAQPFADLLRRRGRREPVAYLVGEREFMELPFGVGPGVLIPRPETEILVEWALRRLGERPDGVVLDIGTGSGAIALSLAHHLGGRRRLRIVASDASVVALHYVTRNRARMGLADRVSLVRGDLAGWCSGPVDLLLANLPYLRPDQVTGNPDLASEPAEALAGGRDGLDLIRRLIQDAPRFLSSRGEVGLELDPGQAEDMLRLGRAALPDREWTVLPDLAGLPRHLVGQIA